MLDRFNYTIVRVWLPDQPGSIGHASLETPNWYLSLWPEGGKKEVSYQSLIRQSLGMNKLCSVRNDCDAEGREPDIAIPLYSLNTQAIEKHLQLISGKLNHWHIGGDAFSASRLDPTGLVDKYSTNLPHNCSSIVFKMLQQGQVRELIPTEEGRTGEIKIVRGAIAGAIGFVPVYTGLTAASFWNIVTNSNPIARKIHGRSEEEEASKGLEIVSICTGPGISITHALCENIFHGTQENRGLPIELAEEHLPDKVNAYLATPPLRTILNNFRYACDVLAPIYPSPQDVAALAAMAKTFELLRFPETQHFPMRLEKEEDYAHFINFLPPVCIEDERERKAVDSENSVFAPFWGSFFPSPFCNMAQIAYQEMKKDGDNLSDSHLSSDLENP